MTHNYFRPFRSEVLTGGETASPAGGGVSPFLAGWDVYRADGEGGEKIFGFYQLFRVLIHLKGIENHLMGGMEDGVQGWYWCI